MKDSTIAFAGMLQAGELVRQTATSGHCSGTAAAVSVGSIFKRSPQTTADVYGGAAGVRVGLQVLTELFSARQKHESMPALNYALGLTKVYKELQRQPARLQAMGNDLDLVEKAWRDSDEALDDSVIAQLADVYKRQISTLRFRLAVSGKPQILKQPEKAAFVRAILLAGLRSAILWHQVGGRQWQLIFRRGKMLQEARSLLTA